MDNINIKDWFERGEVLDVVLGDSCEQIYDYVCKNIKLPSELKAEQLSKELVKRDNVLSTAVGNGIAIPHPMHPILKSNDSQKIVTVYLKNPIDMNAPDLKRVHVMFILLSASSSQHIKALSNLATLLKKTEFMKKVQEHESKDVLIDVIKKVSF